MNIVEIDSRNQYYPSAAKREENGNSFPSRSLFNLSKMKSSNSFFIFIVEDGTDGRDHGGRMLESQRNRKDLLQHKFLLGTSVIQIPDVNIECVLDLRGVGIDQV